MVLKSTYLNHPGGSYLYTIHEDKTNKLCNNGCEKVKDFLDGAFKECPDKLFNGGPRSSMLKFNLNLDVKSITGHEICSLAEHGLKFNENRFRDNHSKVQMFMIENDDKTIAMEVPIWLFDNEIDSFKELFKTKEPLTGHIDLVRIEDNNVWIWDYKPKAHLEKFASTQIYFYALMMSKRTGIRLDRFRCGYFDWNYAYVFKPEENAISKNLKIMDYL